MNTLQAELKKSLRNSIKNTRLTLPETYTNTAQNLIKNKLISYLSSQPKYKIGLYWSMEKELDTHTLLKDLNNLGTVCSLPKVDAISSIMTFFEWKPETKMIRNPSLPFLEPDSKKTMNPTIIIVPLLTCDSFGNRLGYGKGFYDRYLEKHKIFTIGLCYDLLFSTTPIPTEKHDQKLDMIITEARIIKLSS